MKPLAPSQVKHILVVKLRALGDVLTTYPLLRALKEHYPQAKLSMIADETYQDILETNPRIDDLRLHPVGKLCHAGQRASLKQQWDTIKAIRREKIDLFIDLYGSLRTALWGVGGGIPYRMGFNLRGRKYFYNHRIQAKHRYVVDLNLQFAQELGWEKTSNHLEFYLSPSDVFNAKHYLQQHQFDFQKPYIVISPGGGWQLKQWGAERFGEVAKRFSKQTDCQIVLSGSQSEEALLQACQKASGLKMMFAMGLPLRHVAAIIKGSRLFLGNDSGPKYFAEAFNIPTLICYGPTDYMNNNPQKEENQVACFEAECRPCHSEQCRMPARTCMDNISIDDVVGKLHTLWNRSATSNDSL